MPVERANYDHILEALSRGNETELKELLDLVDDFPNGVDDFIGRRWILNAIDCGSLKSIQWMLSQKVELDFRDEEGRTVLHAAIERRNEDRLQCVRLLLESGAPVDIRGFNDWTPAHMAAAWDDVETLKLLKAFGADFALRTTIDNYETPAQQAIRFRSTNALAYLQSEA